MQPERDPLVRDQVIRLMGVLRQLAVAKHSPIRHTSGYSQSLWLHDVADHVAVQVPEGPGEELLRVPRVPREPEPEAPPVLRGWLRHAPESDAVREPMLRERGPVPGDGEGYLVDAPQVRPAFEEWLAGVWRPWAETERVRRPRVRIFDGLFDLSRLAADRPESIELVLASGLLHAPGAADGDDVHIHLVTQPVRVEQDAETGEMVCVLGADAGVRLEDDELLSGLPMFDQSGSAVLRERLLDLADSAVAPGVTTFLKEWAPRALTTACAVEDTWEQPVGPAARLAVAPAVVARRRGAFALRGYYDSIVRALSDPAEPVPLGLAQLVRPVEPADRIAWLERADATAPAELAHDPLFPLPANEEQARIIERLGSDTGVVVEGPPGTGKTHTIANLVSALLARGQRVLVTSEKAQALRVLRDKLPPAMQDLCVSITDASAKGNADLARSVATMASRRTDFDPARSDRRITDLAARRAEARHERAVVLEEIRALREAETYEHPKVAPGHRGTLAAIARTLAGTADVDGWVPGDAGGEPPVSAGELDEVVTLLRTATPDRRARRHQVFPGAELLPVDVVAGLVETIGRENALRSGADGALVDVLHGLPADALVRFDPVCREVAEAAAQLRTLPASGPWALFAADHVLAGNHVHLWQRAVEQLPDVDVAVDRDRRAGFARVQVPASVDLAAAAASMERLAAHLAEGATLRRMFKSAEQRDAERLGDGVLVDGAPPATAAAADAAAQHLRVLEVARRVAAAFAPLQAGLPLDADRALVVDAMLTLRQACAAVERLRRAAEALRELLAVLPPAARPSTVSVVALEQLTEVTATVAAARSAAVARARIEDAAAALLAGAASADRAPETAAVAAALRAHDPGAYDSAVARLDRARREQADQRRCDELVEQLRAASRPLADEIENDPAAEVWAERIARWPRAWARACAASWIVEQTEPGREQRLEADLSVAVSDLRKLTGELAAEQAWRACLARMNAEQVQALQAYRNAMVNVGKGTGIYAERFRSSARDAMAVAQAAVPAWVLPIQQVLASVPPKADSFDVVIVDEASQADLTSAFLLWLAPRVIVVGDDKQCTPSEVASGALQPVFERLDAELHDLPSYLRTAFTPKDSIFSLLRSRFGQVVRLREHFRCMPEIISWSSGMFYRDAPLVPLRQFGADRLPPLRATHVAGAYADPTRGSFVNRAEAVAIAESVTACIDDPAYAGRTFGVVVLQGHPQVDLITNELMTRISPADWADRRLRVGTPPDFQGDERHVVWLSMVAAPGSPLRALTRRNFEQSYNVAASRAQDQLWLFHSVMPDLLSQADLRHSLLSYMLADGASALEPVLTGVDPDRRHDAFDSLFEQRVYLDLIARGYHVTPQVESNRRRIDLVVTGAAGKLAVECDGEAFHTTPEQREADLDREQELKRCGWTFERIRESTYYLDRAVALAPVWATLDRLGIGPLGRFTDGTWTPRPGP